MLKRIKYIELLEDFIECNSTIAEIMKFRDDSFKTVDEEKFTIDQYLVWSGIARQVIQIPRTHGFDFAAFMDKTKDLPDFLFVLLVTTIFRNERLFKRNYYRHKSNYMFTYLETNENYEPNQIIVTFYICGLFKAFNKPYQFMLDFVDTIGKNNINEREFSKFVDALLQFDISKVNYDADFESNATSTMVIPDWVFVNYVLMRLASYINYNKIDYTSSSSQVFKLYSLMFNNKKFVNIIEKIRSLNCEDYDYTGFPYAEDFVDVAHYKELNHFLDNTTLSLIKCLNFQIHPDTLFHTLEQLIIYSPVIDYSCLTTLENITKINQAKSIYDITFGRIDLITLTKLFNILKDRFNKYKFISPWSSRLLSLDNDIILISKMANISNPLTDIYDYYIAFKTISNNPSQFVYMNEYQRYTTMLWNNINKSPRMIDIWCESLSVFELHEPDAGIDSSDIFVLPINNIPDTVFVAAMIATLNIHMFDPNDLNVIMDRLSSNETFASIRNQVNQFDLTRFGIS